MFRIAAVLVATLALGTSSVMAQTPEEAGAPKKRSELKQANLKKLFQQLGADSYDTREAASIKLLAYGRDIIPALKKLYEKTKDPEVKGRAFYLAEKIHRDRLRKKGKGYLGVRINTGAVNPMGGSSIEINSVEVNLPAAKVGLKKGDRILEINKMKVQNFDELKAAITSYAAGDKIAVVVLRGKKKLTFYPVLAKFPSPKKTATTVRPQVRGNIIRPRIQVLPNQPRVAPQGNAAILKALNEQLKTLKKAKNPDKKQIERIEQILKVLKAQGAPKALPVVPPRRGIKIPKGAVPGPKFIQPKFNLPAPPKAVFPQFAVPFQPKAVFPQYNFPEIPKAVFPQYNFPEIPKAVFPQYNFPEIPKAIFPQYNFPEVPKAVFPQYNFPKPPTSIFPKIGLRKLKEVSPTPKKDKKK